MNFKLVTDSIKSFIGNLGNKDRDKAAGVFFDDVYIDDHELMAAYKGNWIARKIIEIPVKDALRKWRIWNSDKREDIEAEEKRLGVRKKVQQAKIKGRLFGGAAVFIGTDQDPSEPLNLGAIGLGGVKYLTVMTRRELMASTLVQDPMSEQYGKPVDYMIGTTTAMASIHPSRLVIFNGDEHANEWLEIGVNQGWGQSVLLSVATTIKQAGGTLGNVASLIFEANVDVIKVPDLMANIGDKEYESNLLQRFALAATGKGINGTLVIDGEEDYERRAASFANLSDLIEKFLLACSAAADIPATRFLGRSPTGLAATGDGDMDNYHDRLQADQELDFGPAMYLLDECLKRSAGAESDASYEWAPLSQLDEKELSEVGKNIAETLVKIHSIGVLRDTELRDLAVHKMAESKVFPHIEHIIAETKAESDLDDDFDDDPDEELEAA